MTTSKPMPVLFAAAAATATAYCDRPTVVHVPPAASAPTH
jgi:hypothetical protein